MKVEVNLGFVGYFFFYALGCVLWSRAGRQGGAWRCSVSSAHRMGCGERGGLVAE